MREMLELFLDFVLSVEASERGSRGSRSRRVKTERKKEETLAKMRLSRAHHEHALFHLSARCHPEASGAGTPISPGARGG